MTLHKGSLRTTSAVQRLMLKLLYQWQEGVEQLEGYQPGGYHPTHIGDRFHDGRYKIVHKLGHGSYSTVWLARDEKEDRNVALKILVAEASKTSSESKILRALQAGRFDHPGRPYVSSFLEDFSFVGPNGQHLCLVTEAAGCSVAFSKDASTTWLFPVNVSRAISAEVLLGLDYIHSCNVVHGDLHSNNILFQPPGLESSTVEEIYRPFGEPQRLPVQRLDGAKIGSEAPSYCVPPAMLAISSEDVTDARVKIFDFGEAFFANEKDHQTLNTPILLLPPESFFHAPLGPAVDVWTVGCTLYEILGERPLFEGFMPDEDDVIAGMINFFLEDGSWKEDTERNHDPKSRPLKQRLKEMGQGEDLETCEFSAEEMESLAALLRSMLTFNPVNRIKVCDAVNSEWMKKWGLPAIGEVGSLIDRN